ncbi:PIR protein [Plasmodium sp. DRC-Itaito]|nr:PIR protein [Plasmodium sp. DRC-Itaito]
MKVHYINILLFVIALNILDHNQRNHYITIYTQTNRSLCECDLYMPNYDNDPEMKMVMQQFEDRTSQRFKEYDDRMKSTRQKCKDQCNKEIQKIILKDKLEKQMAEQLTTLETKIDTNDIPTCICEKSLADKMEKNCMKCGGILGTAVPELGTIGGTVVYAAAVKSATDLGTKIGMETAISDLKALSGLEKLIGAIEIENFVTPTNYFHKMSIIQFLQKVNIKMCQDGANSDKVFCNFVTYNGVPKLVERGSGIADNARLIGAQFESEKFAEMTSISAIFSHPVVISAIVVVIIAVILLIIYFILRYRRKKKMKKKLEYIKLLNQ